MWLWVQTQTVNLLALRAHRASPATGKQAQCGARERAPVLTGRLRGPRTVFLTGFLPREGGEPWHRLPGAAADAPSLELLEPELDGAWSDLVEWDVTLPRQGLD